MIRVRWRDGHGSPVVEGRASMPKKPVIWWGEAWLELPDGDKVKSAWKSKQPMTVDQARMAMHAVVADLKVDHGKTGAVDAGFYMQCR